MPAAYRRWPCWNCERPGSPPPVADGGQELRLKKMPRALPPRPALEALMLSRLHARSFTPLLGVALASAALVACGSRSRSDRRADTSAALLEVVARDLAFDAPD